MLTHPAGCLPACRPQRWRTSEFIILQYEGSLWRFFEIIYEASPESWLCSTWKMGVEMQSHSFQKGIMKKQKITILSRPRLPRKAVGALEMLKTQLNKALSNLFQILGLSCFEKALDLQMSLPPQII